jgi:GH15 family glucan-1,4-alpha-glucosidase
MRTVTPVLTADSALIHHSIDVITRNQAPSGAYVASPTFAQYRYCWFRDGSFSARAMDVAGRTASARRFHDWAARTILASVAAGGRGGPRFEARYRLDGTPAADSWPTYQLDGFGTWLWAVAAHVEEGGEAAPGWLEAAAEVERYLLARWSAPCYDWWEEAPSEVHVSTLGAIWAGLRSSDALLGHDTAKVQAAIVETITSRGMVEGRLVKSLDRPDVDASLVALGVPYGVFDPSGRVMAATVEAIERDLLDDGGVHRYRADTFYGGGRWVLLTAWLAWHHRCVGHPRRAQRLLDWVEEQANDHFDLPEQSIARLNDPSSLASWVSKWGPVATPLLWSHAMYLLAALG